VKRSAVAIAGCLVVFTSGAFAYDFAAKGRFGETLDGGDNYFLSHTPAGATFRSLSALNLNFSAQTPTTQYLLDTSYSYYKYFGPGAAQTNPSWGTPANAGFQINHTEQLTRYNFVARWSRVDTATTTLAQTGVATGSGTTDTLSVGGGFTHDLSRIDTISWSATANTASSSAQDFTPYRDVLSSIAWNHTLGELTSLNSLVSFDYFAQDNAANTQRLLWRFETGIQSRLTRRLNFNGRIGVLFANSYQNASAPSTLTPPALGVLTPAALGVTPIQIGAGHGWVGSVGLSYDLLKTTTVSFNVAQSIFPTLTGQLSKSETIELALKHQINQASNLSFTAQFAKSQTGAEAFQTGTSSDFYTAQIIYSYRLSRDWGASVSYTYQQRNDTIGVVNTNIGLISLNYDFNLFGNPTAINIAERERGRERARQTQGYVFPGAR